ncbi:MAG TPA: CAP domain-containing protein, partial [Acidimicrobiales bacterium]|nr:CAP domain-containing protein [Acidimicrobiales bacterium]
FVLTGDESSAPSSTVAPDGTEAEIQGLLSFKDVMQMKSLINDRRATGTKCGATQMPPVPALRVNRALNVAAQKHADDMASKNFFSHTGSDGSTVGQRVTQSGYQWSAVGENIAAGTNTTSVGAAVNQLWTSEPHCKNFISPKFTEWHAGRANNPSSTYTNYFAIVLAKPL